jgi:hypothetical protein
LRLFFSYLAISSGIPYFTNFYGVIPEKAWIFPDKLQIKFTSFIKVHLSPKNREAYPKKEKYDDSFFPQNGDGPYSIHCAGGIRRTWNFPGSK